MKTLITGMMCICLSVYSKAQTQGIRMDGELRQFTMYIPETLDKEKPAPLVFNFHGFGMTAVEHMFYSDMNVLADKHQFIMIYPQGKNKDWNVGFGMDYDEGSQDVAFIRELVRRVQKHFNIDANAIFATGLSRGGFFTYRLATEMPETFAAIASVGAPIPDEVMKRHTVKKPVGVMHAHGVADDIVKYEGKDKSYQSVASTIEYWKSINKGKDAVVEKVDVQHDSTSVTLKTYHGEKDVVLIQIENGGHTWPGANDFNTGMPLGKTTHDIAFNEMMWQFFKANRKGAK